MVKCIKKYNKTGCPGIRIVAWKDNALSMQPQHATKNFATTQTFALDLEKRKEMVS